jgi:serine/threonine protein kinase/Tol biopolymer transport system component
MAPSPGTRLGPYELLATVGAGGMGQVYRARDTRLNRDVAVKVLSGEDSSREELRSRLAREARAIASLSHPNICTVYDFAQQEDIDYLVMELLEGETLAERLERGPMRIDELLECGLQIADALGEAHRRGLVHRDLKPANVMLTRAGAKLLDFGLARTIRLHARDETLTVTVSGAGTMAGTFRYMSPEQLEGRELDHRTDIFSFGALLYEMATAKKAFPGQSAASVIAAVMEREPAPLLEVRPGVPRGLHWLIQTCLRKDPEERWQTVHDIRLQLKRLIDEPGEAASNTRDRRVAPIGIAAAAAAAALVLGGLTGAWLMSQRPPSRPGAVRFEVPAPAGGSFNTSTLATVPVAALALSPDGERIAFVAERNGPAMIWVRSLGETTARPLGGTEGAQYPFWSPTGRWIGFFAHNQLKRIDAAGGPATTLADVSMDPRGGAWLSSNVIVYSPGLQQGLMRVPAGGGRAEPVFAAEKNTEQRWWPSALPDGKRFLYYDRARNGLAVGGLDGSTGEPVVRTDWGGAYAPDRADLLYLSGGALIAQPFDVARGVTTGEAAVLQAGVGGATNGEAGFSSSPAGVVAWSRTLAERTRLTWYDRRGNVLERLNEAGYYLDFRMSPDERWVAWSLVDPMKLTPDIWLHDRERGATTRLTTDPLLEASPVWSADSSKILYRSNRTGTVKLYVRELGGRDDEALMVEERQWQPHPGSSNLVPTDWSPDGRHVVYSAPRATGFDLFALPRFDQKVPYGLSQSEFNEIQGSLSPDGRWLAFTSDDSGRFEVYVQTFPEGKNRQQVSAEGATNPRWRGDGRELYYLSAARKIRAVSFRPNGEIGRPEDLFTTRAATGAILYVQSYQPSRDGQRFLVNSVVEDEGPPVITVVVGR